MPRQTKSKSDIVIAGAARTPVGLKCGPLADPAAEDLAVLAAEEVLPRG